MRGPDLNYGYEQWVRRDETVDEHLDSLLVVLQHKAQSGSQEQGSRVQAGKESENERDRDRLRADVITWRGIATKLCTAIFAENSHDAWELNVLQVGKTLYLEEFVSPAARREKVQSTDRRLLGFMYQGYAFESFCTSPAIPAPKDQPSSSKTSTSRDPPGWGGTVCNNVQWCAICKTSLGSNRLIIGGEVDCIQPSALPKYATSDLLHNPRLDSDDFVELKTTAEIRNARDRERFEGTKMLRFYYQSFLLGVPSIVTGFRDRAGFLADVQTLSTLQLPRIVRAQHPKLDAGKGLAFANQILDWVRQYIAQDPTASQLSNAPPPLAEAEADFPVFRLAFTPSGGIGIPSHGPQHGGTLAIRRLPTQDVLRDIKEGQQAGRVGFLLSSYFDFARQRLVASGGAVVS